MAPFWEILKDLNCCYTIWEAFGNIWATFYSNIWSHKLKNEKEEEEEDKKVKKKRNFSFFKWLSVCLQQVQEFLDTFHITLPPCLSLSPQHLTIQIQSFSHLLTNPCTPLTPTLFLSLNLKHFLSKFYLSHILSLSLSLKTHFETVCETNWS